MGPFLAMCAVLVMVGAGCGGEPCQAPLYLRCDAVFDCPSWSGLSQQDHALQEDVPYYNGLWAPHDRWRVEQYRSYDETTGESRVEFRAWDGFGYSFDFDPNIYGELVGLCAWDGYRLTGRNISWHVTDVFHRYKISMETTTTWNPPILEIPTDAEVGVTWDIASTQTTTGPDGVTVESEVSERREVIEQRLLDTTLGEQMALVVETSRGHRLYYVEGAGLVRGEALIRDGVAVPYGGD